MKHKYDAIIIGAGHNGLVTAAYLARGGRKVLVLERRELIGGCVVTEELWPGFKVSTASYVNSLFRPEIIRDLELKRHGFTFTGPVTAYATMQACGIVNDHLAACFFRTRTP